MTEESHPCEHCGRLAPPLKRFCGPACARCEVTECDERYDCAAVCEMTDSELTVAAKAPVANWSPDIVRLAGLVADGVRWAKANGVKVTANDEGVLSRCPLGAVCAQRGRLDAVRPGSGFVAALLGIPVHVSEAFVNGFDGRAGYHDDVDSHAYRMGADYRRRAEMGKL